MELLLISLTPGLAEALGAFEGLEIVAAPGAARGLSLLTAAHPPDALYVEEGAVSLDDLWRVVRAAQSGGITALVGLRSAGAAYAADFADAGLPVTSELRAAPLADWAAARLGLRRRAGSAQALIAVAGAKGGIGKSLVVAILAEGMRRRGMRVLVIDGDLSNSGIVPTFRIASGFPSYLQIVDDAAAVGEPGDSCWSPANVRRYVYRHRPSGLDFLLGSEETTDPRDMQRPQWLALMQAVRGLDEYDVVLLDTGPEIKKRPYAILAARDQGWVVLPTPPGRKERTGAGNMLRALQTAVRDRDLTDRCLLLFMEPERGVTVTVDHIAPLFARHFPQARVLGQLPRAPRQVSVADEEGDRYISPLDVAPHSRFSRTAHALVDRLCGEVGLRPPQPMPRTSLLQRLRGERIALPAAHPPQLAAEEARR